MTETRDFHIGDILTVISDIMVSPNGVDGIYRLLDFMTGDGLFTHQLPRAAGECGPALRAQHPDLAQLHVPTDMDGDLAVLSWLAAQVDRYGATRPVARLDPVDHTRIDPITELRMIRPDLPVITVDMTDAQEEA